MFNFLKKKDNGVQPPIETGNVDIAPPVVFDQVADELDVEVELLKAFVKVESGSCNSLNGKPICRWETHIFKRYTGINIYVHGLRGRINAECQGNEYEAFNRGCLVRDGKYEKQAYMSASWGMGQIMGFHYKRLGFNTPKEMVEWIGESDDNGIRSIGRFIKTHAKLLKACQTKDFYKIAYYYNGAYFEKYAPEGKQYDDKIKAEYERLTA